MSVSPGLFVSERVALAHTPGHASVPRCTRLLFHHQCHLKPNQTSCQCPLEYNALCVPAQHAHLFTVGLSSTTPSRFKFVRPRITHTLTWIWCSRRRPLQEPQTRSTRACWSEHPPSPPLPHDSGGVEPVQYCTMHVCADATRTRQQHDGGLLWDHKFSVSDSQPSLLFPSPPRDETCGNWSADNVGPDWLLTLQYERLNIFGDVAVFATLLCGLRVDSGMQRMADQDVQRVVCLDLN